MVPGGEVESRGSGIRPDKMLLMGMPRSHSSGNTHGQAAITTNSALKE